MENSADNAGDAPGKGFRSGFLSLTGKPNVGKSTFLNAVLGEKVSIVAPKPQTTRNRIVGIKTLENAQVVFLDTPGIHRPRHKLGARMVAEARRAVSEVDLVLYMVEPGPPTADDRAIIRLLSHAGKPVFLLINKIDTVKKPELLPVIAEYGRLMDFKEVFPVSALRGEGVGIVVEKAVEFLPEGPRYYPEEMVTDSIERFMAAEIIREKIILLTGEEVPHSAAVEIVEWKGREAGGVYIGANIFVEKDGQKGIIIGSRGEKIKEIGTLARREIEGLLGTKVYLELWVKVRRGWRTDNEALREMGF